MKTSLAGLGALGFSKPKSAATIGLDIGSYSVKCVELLREEQKVSLASAQSARLASDSEAGLAEAVRGVLQGMSGAVPRHLRISVSGPSVFIRNVDFPRMTAEELKNAIRFEAERHIPFPIDDCALDFQVISRADNKTSMKVLLAAVKKEHVHQRIKLLEKLGFAPEIVDSDIFCFVNAYEKLNRKEGLKTYGLLDIGHSVSSFAIIHGGELFFVREMLFGGQEVTKVLGRLKNVSEEEADKRKREKDPKDPRELVLATQKGFEPLLDELRRSIDYFENEAGEELKEIFMAGGGAKSYGASETLSGGLGKGVSLWSPAVTKDWAGAVDPKFLEEHSSEFHVAYGLALREVE